MGTVNAIKLQELRWFGKRT